MNAFVLIAAILQTLALVARNPSIGFDATRYADLLEFLGRLVQRGNAAVDELKLLRTEVEGIIEQGRAPSEDEIARWKARSDAAHQGLQRLKDSSPEDQGEGSSGDPLP
jgi:hypothetical protein